MTTRVLQFVELSDRDRKAAKPLGKLGKGDQVEVRVWRKSGQDQVVKLPLKAAALLQSALGRLLEGERVAVLAEDQELSPNDAAGIIGVSRPLVVHRMDVGDLPFRYVGKHRRTKLKVYWPSRRISMPAARRLQASTKLGRYGENGERPQDLSPGGEFL